MKTRVRKKLRLYIIEFLQNNEWCYFDTYVSKFNAKRIAKNLSKYDDIKECIERHKQKDSYYYSDGVKLK